MRKPPSGGKRVAAEPPEASLGHAILGCNLGASNEHPPNTKAKPVSDPTIAQGPISRPTFSLHHQKAISLPIHWSFAYSPLAC
jgi:hypothetical protein